MRRVSSASMRGVKVEGGRGGREGCGGVLVGEKEGGREAVIRARAAVREGGGMSSMSGGLLVMGYGGEGREGGSTGKGVVGCCC